MSTFISKNNSNKEKIVEAIMFRLSYIPTDNSPYPNKKTRSEKEPALVIVLGRVNFCKDNKSIFHAKDDSEKNLQVSREIGEVYRDTVWFEYNDDIEIDDLKRKAAKALYKSKEKKLVEAENTIALLQDTLLFLRNNIF